MIQIKKGKEKEKKEKKKQIKKNDKDIKNNNNINNNNINNNNKNIHNNHINNIIQIAPPLNVLFKRYLEQNNLKEEDIDFTKPNPIKKNKKKNKAINRNNIHKKFFYHILELVYI